MKRLSILSFAAFILLSASQLLVAGEPRPGSVATVTCKDNKNQKYVCYLPSKYTASEPWPILYCFSPGARGGRFVSAYKSLGEKYGWIVVGSLNSKNGPWTKIQAACEAMFNDCEQRFNLSDYMRYASGFSGGAEASFNLTDQHYQITGVIPIGNTRSGKRADALGAGPLRKTVRVFLTCGKRDFNYEGLKSWVEKLKNRDYTIKSHYFDGGHEMAPKSVLKDAVKWIIDVGPGWAAMKAEELEDEDGVKISHIMRGGPAYKSDLKEGDIIKEINGEKIKTHKDYAIAMQKTAPGKEAEFGLKKSSGMAGKSSKDEDLKKVKVKLIKRVPR